MSRYIEIRKHSSPQLSKFLASITTASFSTRSGLRKTAHNSLFLRFTSSTNQIKPPLQPPAALLLISSLLTRRREVASTSGAPYLQELVPFLILYLNFRLTLFPLLSPAALLLPGSEQCQMLLCSFICTAIFLLLCVCRCWAQKSHHHTPYRLRLAALCWSGQASTGNSSCQI